jgi:hypothetical protein
VVGPACCSRGGKPNGGAQVSPSILSPVSWPKGGRGQPCVAEVGVVSHSGSGVGKGLTKLCGIEC